jgi:DMSO reductase family type II enzyme chaperone
VVGVDTPHPRAGERAGPAEEAMSDDALVGALHRAAIYRVLSLAFAYPTPARLQAVADAAVLGATTAAAALAPALDRLATASRAAEADALAAEHIALFQRQLRCPPYEGAYGPPQMAGKSALLADVAGFYTAFGLEPAAGQPEAEDHIGAELEFMSALALKEAWALSENEAAGLEVTRAAQRVFLFDHLGRWAHAFAERLDAEATPGVLPAAAALLHVWLELECVRLEVTPLPLEGVSVPEEAPLSCPRAPAEE